MALPWLRSNASVIIVIWKFDTIKCLEFKETIQKHGLLALSEGMMFSFSLWLTCGLRCLPSPLLMLNACLLSTWLRGGSILVLGLQYRLWTIFNPSLRFRPLGVPPHPQTACEALEASLEPQRPQAQSITTDLEFSHEEHERERAKNHSATKCELTLDHLKGWVIRRNGGPFATWAILGVIFYRGHWWVKVQIADTCTRTPTV